MTNDLLGLSLIDSTSALDETFLATEVDGPAEMPFIAYDMMLPLVADEFDAPLLMLWGEASVELPIEVRAARRIAM